MRRPFPVLYLGAEKWNDMELFLLPLIIRGWPLLWVALIPMKLLVVLTREREIQERENSVLGMVGCWEAVFRRRTFCTDRFNSMQRCFLHRTASRQQWRKPARFDVPIQFSAAEHREIDLRPDLICPGGRLQTEIQQGWTLFCHYDHYHHHIRNIPFFRRFLTTFLFDFSIILLCCAWLALICLCSSNPIYF